jgi:hypothetical protein
MFEDNEIPVTCSILPRAIELEPIDDVNEIPVTSRVTPISIEVEPTDDVNEIPVRFTLALACVVTELVVDTTPVTCPHEASDQASSPHVVVEPGAVTLTWLS